MARLIGTAGHVDHGKTTLIHALTGIDADRLPEEKQRGMTIDIGFAFMDLPKVGRVSIVDVPGHEKFLTNMLVGALGIDVALLCVAADESVMPQTREHLQILELLPVERLVVALTRADLADEVVRGMARLEVEELVAASRFGSAPIIEVSAVTGEGLVALRELLAETLSGQEAKIAGPWYLPIDRAFGVKGHGCVVTGTMAQGVAKAGDRAILEPGGHEVRVRSIHWHGESLATSEKGKRTALNLGGIRVEDVTRGQCVGEAGALFETTCLDARVRWIGGPCKHGLRVRTSIGADEAFGKIFLNEQDPDVVQLRLEKIVACALSQPLIVRRYSPPDLLAGGRVVVPVAKVRRRTEAATVVEGGQEDGAAILQVLAGRIEGVATDEICRILGRTPQALGDAFESLQEQGKARGLGGLWFGAPEFVEAATRFLSALSALHEASPMQAMIPRERAVEAAKLPWAGKPLDRIMAALTAEGKLRSSGTSVRHPEFSIRMTLRQSEFLSRVTAELVEGGINVPGPVEISHKLGAPVQAVEEILRLGVEAGEVARVGDGIFYAVQQIEGFKRRIAELAGGRPFAAAVVRDGMGTTRKYAIPLLEYLDSIRFTTRTGDLRTVNR